MKTEGCADCERFGEQCLTCYCRQYEKVEKENLTHIEKKYGDSFLFRLGKREALNRSFQKLRAQGNYDRAQKQEREARRLTDALVTELCEIDAEEEYTPYWAKQELDSLYRRYADAVTSNHYQRPNLAENIRL